MCPYGNTSTDVCGCVRFGGASEAKSKDYTYNGQSEIGAFWNMEHLKVRVGLRQGIVGQIL